jgi:protein YibB
MNTTIVTGIYDIGRGSWPNFNRTYNEYFKYFKNILSLDCNIVIYIDEKDLNVVTLLRSEIDPNFNKTKIITNNFTELEAYKKFYNRTKEVMSGEIFKSRRFESHTPEMIYPEYNIINYNKVSFLEDTIKNNYFNSQYFIWLDAGYAHHRFPTEILYKKYPNPDKIKVLDDNKVHFLTLCDIKDTELSSFYDPRVSIVGSLFCGKAEPLLQLKEICFSVIDEFLNNNAINDDQTIYAYAYKHNKNLFNLTQGDWFQNIHYYI